MPKEYTPRRANLSRWLQGAPSYILDVLDDKGSGDRYTVIFTKEMSSQTGSYAGTWIAYLGMSGSPTHPQGVSMWGEFKAYECAQYRARCGKHRIRWNDLPEHIREHVIGRAASTEESAP